MFFRIFQYVGITFIVAFCAVSIFFATSERDFGSYNLNNSNFTYASFFEDRFYDLRMKYTIDKNKKDDRMVLAAIDDHSLSKIGRWPWTRTIHAKIIDKLNKDVNQALADPALRNKFAELGAEPVVGPPEDLTQKINSDIKKWTVIIQKGGITLDKQ